MPNPYNPNPYNEDQDRARQQPLYDQPGGLRQDTSQEYHKGDGVFQIPWWVIVITFCFAAWPIGVAMMIINHLLRMGKISAPQSWSQNNRQTGQPYTVRPIYADPQKAEKMRRDAQRVVQRAEEAAHKAEKRVEIYQNADRAQTYDPEQTARQNERGRKDKGEGWSIALTVLGVIFSIAMVANLPEAVYWLPEALTQGGSYWTWLFQDLAGSVTLLFAGAGFLFAGWKLRTGRRIRKKISNIVGNAPYMKIQEIADAIGDVGFFASIPLWLVTLLGSLFITVLAFIMILTVYGRFFKIYMYAALSPVALASFAGEGTSHFGKAFLRSYVGVCMEGAVIVLACIIFSAFSSSGTPVVDSSASVVTQVWSYLGEVIFNLLVLVGLVKSADHIAKEMLGL